MVRFFLSAGAVCGLTAVLFGAFGAHGLSQHLSPVMMNAYEKGVDYHSLHALALLAIGLMLQLNPSRCLVWAGGMMLIGIILFSGSLYLMAITHYRPLGIITPFGGTAFIIGWGCLLKAAMGFGSTNHAKKPAKE